MNAQTQAIPPKTAEAMSDFESLSNRSALVRDRAADFLGVEPSSLLKVLRAHFDDGQGELSALELLTAITLIGRYELDPMRREIHVVRSRGRVFTCIGIDGWIRVVTSNPHYDGHEHEFAFDESGKPVSCTVRIFHRERSHATSYTALLDEWLVPTNPNWKQRPGHMLQLRAFTHAARYFSAIGQVYEHSEINDMIAHENARAEPKRIPSLSEVVANGSIPQPRKPASQGRMATREPEPEHDFADPVDDEPPTSFVPDDEPHQADEEPPNQLRLMEIARSLGIPNAGAMRRKELEAAIAERQSR